MLLWIMIACDFKHGPGSVPPVPLLFAVSLSGRLQSRTGAHFQTLPVHAGLLPLSLSGYQKGTEVTVLNPS